MADDDGKDTQTDDKAATKAINLGIPDSAGHKGTITIDDNAPIESVIIAYHVVGKLADFISARVKGHSEPKTPILMHNPADFAALNEYRAFVELTNAYRKIFKELLAKANELGKTNSLAASLKHLEMFSLTAAAAVGAVGGIINTGLQILSLFRADHAIKNNKVEWEDQILAISVAGRLAGERAVFSSGIVPVKPQGQSEALKTLAEFEELRIQLQSAAERIGAADDADKPPADVNAAGQPTTKPAPSDQREKLRTQIVQAFKDFDAFMTGLSKVDEKTSLPKLSQILAGEHVDAVLDKGALIVWVKAVAAGGGTHAKTTTFTSDLTYSGGAIASYAIFDSFGQLKEAETVPMYGGKVSIDELPGTEIKLYRVPTPPNQQRHA